MKNTLLILFTFFSVISFGQKVEGIVKDESRETLIGALIVSGEEHKTRSDLDGRFSISVDGYPATLTISYMGYETKEIRLKEAQTKPLEVVLVPTTQEVDGVVVSASRRQQKIENIPVSLEIIKPELIENKGLTNVEEAVNQAPGAYAMDGQISIRGGSGFSYGAGSRVMVVWNDVPLLSGDAGDAKWQSIPLENISQIEVLKGASSVLYGSGALNGIVSMRDKEPTMKGETAVSWQTGIYDNPRRQSLNWSDSPLLSHQLNVFHGKMHKQVGYTFSAYGFLNDSYRAGASENRGRFNGTVVYKPKSLPKVRAGLNYSFNQERRGLFIVWESDSLAYYPQGGTADPYSDSSSLSLNDGTRIIVDPYVKWYDPRGNKHSIQNRIYYTLNKTEGNNQSAAATMLFSDYKFEKKWDNGLVMTSGLTGNWNTVNSDLYGDHNSKNYAIYSQLEKRFGKLDLTAGVRGEYFQQNELDPDSYTYLRSDSTGGIPIRPIFRVGAHYELKEFTHLRASFGQAYRYPSVAERFASTSVGALNIFPNPDLRPEQGWSAELGFKQGFKIKDWKGFIDVAGFINEYDNMMEFAFNYYKPDSVPFNFNEIERWIGFRAENAESARITGLDVSLNGTGKIGPVEVIALMGYTYMNPISLNEDSTYIYGDGPFGGFSDTSSNMLKYRFNHLAKGDIQFRYKNWTAGFSGRYNSFMTNIDAVFEGANIFGNEIEILPGLKEYRERNNKGDLVFDARVGYHFTDNILAHFIVNNVFNREYMTRPGDIQAPRLFMLRLQAKF